MRKELNIFVNPNTQKSLSLKVKEERRGHIISGKLYNGKSEYPIIRGIPRFTDEKFYKKDASGSRETQTAQSFGDKWCDKRYKKLGTARQDIKSIKEQFMAMLGCKSIFQLKEVFLKSKRVLNAGCGVAWPEYLFNYNQNTQRHCIDISLSVEAAYKYTKEIKNVSVSQSSIFKLPYQDEVFDIIYSLGVIHHTPDPKGAFISLVKKLKAGGLIGIYIYNQKPFLREIADREIRKLTTKMSYDECMRFSKQMTKLGKALSQMKKQIKIDQDVELLGIKKGEYDIHELIYNYFFKCWYNPKQDEKYADLVNQDWYHPSFASHHTRGEVSSWFREAGVGNINFIQPKGWEHSGFFVSGRKK